MPEGAVIRTVAEVMSHPVVTAVPSEVLSSVSERMCDHSVGSVVVVDGERAIGILTERDLVRFGAAGVDSSATKVSEWMTENPDSVRPDETVVKAFARLSEFGYRHIPVVDDGRLVGIVSMRDLMRVASLEPVQSPGQMEAPKGLAGVIVAETEVGDVRGREGFYHYRQYNAVELAEQRSIEDVWYLMFEGALPDRAQREEFIERVNPLRVIPPGVEDLMEPIAQAGERFVPLDALRTAVSLVAADADFQASLDISLDQL
jgi:CBS domain-containing protein